MAEDRNVFWIASYPKSGNTWVRFIVCNILKGAPVENSGEIEELTPDVHKRSVADLPLDRDRLYLKTHWACTPAMPLYDRTVGAIYVVRHPGDVLASNLAYLCVPRRRWTPFVDQFIELGGLAHWTGFGMGTWFDNLQSWTGGQHPFPVYVVGYESLLKEPAQSIRKIAEHIGHPVSAEEAERIAHETSFSRMRAIEVREKNRSSEKNSFFARDAAAVRSGKRVFMRSGKSNQFQSILTPQQKVQFDRRFGPALDVLGLRP